jgi:hypothetical protein
VVIRSRRIDRMNRVAPVEGERFPTNYEMIRANRRPESMESASTPIDPDPISVSPETRTRFTREEYSVFRGEGTAPTITEAVIRGGDISRVSESRYPIVELSLSNGAKLAKKIRVSDHGQVSQFSPGEYGIDVRGSKLSDEQVVERAMDQLQEWVTEVWRDQGNIPKSSLRTNRADSSVIEQYNASNRKLAEAKSKLMTEVNANSTQRRIWQGAVDKYSLAIERLKRDFPGVSLPQ